MAKKQGRAARTRLSMADQLKRLDDAKKRITLRQEIADRRAQLAAMKKGK